LSNRIKNFDTPRAGLRDFDGDGGDVSELVRGLRYYRSRWGRLPIIVRGDTAYVVEVHPGPDDLRVEDLPWGLLPWRPMWFPRPELTPKAREVFLRLRLVHLVRTQDATTCLTNELTGTRLLTEGPARQDATAKGVPCEQLADDLAQQPALGNVADRLRAALLAPVAAPAFVRQRVPNVDAFPVHRSP
jgi:hypothetical protein